MNTFVNIIAQLTSTFDLVHETELNVETFDDSSSAGHHHLPPPHVLHPTHLEGPPVGLGGSTSRRTGGSILL